MKQTNLALIVKEIASGLIGEKEKDLAYLREQITHYQDHEQMEAIYKICVQIENGILDEDILHEYRENLDSEQKTFEKQMEKARRLLVQNQHDQALVILEEMVDTYGQLSVHSDKDTLYFDFDEAIEHILYDCLYDPTKNIKNAQFRYNELYLAYGTVLFEQERYEEAEVAFEEAMRWNPTNAFIALEYADALKEQGKLESFYQANLDLYPFIVYPEDLARFYRNLGFYFRETGSLQTAASCYRWSLQYDQQNYVLLALSSISELDSSIQINPDNDLIDSCFEVNDIPFGPSDEMLQLAINMLLGAKKNHDQDIEQYFSKILEPYLDLDDIDAMLDKVEFR